MLIFFQGTVQDSSKQRLLNPEITFKVWTQPKALATFFRFTEIPLDSLCFIYTSSFAVANAGISVLDCLSSISDSSSALALQLRTLSLLSPLTKQGLVMFPSPLPLVAIAPSCASFMPLLILQISNLPELTFFVHNATTIFHLYGKISSVKLTKHPLWFGFMHQYLETAGY